MYGDAFYYWNETTEAQLFASTAGLLIDGAKPATLPPYSESHQYSVPYTGTGNQLQGNYALADYTDVANKIIYIETCPVV